MAGFAELAVVDLPVLTRLRWPGSTIRYLAGISPMPKRNTR